MIYLRMQKNSYKEDEDKNYNLFKETVTEVPLLRGRGWRSRGKIRQWYRDNNIWHQDINNALVACGLNDEWNHVNHWELYSNLLYYLICVDSKVDLIAMVAFTPSVRGRRANYNLYLFWWRPHLLTGKLLGKDSLPTPFYLGPLLNYALGELTLYTFPGLSYSLCLPCPSPVARGLCS